MSKYENNTHEKHMNVYAQNKFDVRILFENTTCINIPCFGVKTQISKNTPIANQLLLRHTYSYCVMYWQRQAV